MAPGGKALNYYIYLNCGAMLCISALSQVRLYCSDEQPHRHGKDTSKTLAVDGSGRSMCNQMLVPAGHRQQRPIVQMEAHKGRMRRTIESYELLSS